MLDKRTFENSKYKRNRMKMRMEKDPFLQDFHIYPKTGWLNDPNGLCEFKKDFHIYYQYSPLDENRDDIIWGHIKTKDFISFKRLEPFIYSDSPLDKDGAYSGSAFVENDKIYYFYTGNVKHQGDFDYVNDGRDHNTLRVVSEDGENFETKEVILKNSDYPKDMTRHVRDPKIYKKDGTYYMFLGARSKEDKGLVLVYKSENLKDFSYHMRIETDYDFGYMWECPDFFSLEGKDILICCPQGLESEDYRYQNIYQAGYFPIEIDFDKKTYQLGGFKELDYGFDFYAPQTFKDQKDRRILIGWMGMPDASYKNPTIAYSWQHCLTIPREILLKDGFLCQRPISELKNLRTNKDHLRPGEIYKNKTYEAYIENTKVEFSLFLRADVKLDYKDGILSLDMGDSSYGRNIRRLRVSCIYNIRVFSDLSSLEIFINDGAYVLSTRVYSDKYKLYSDDFDLTVYDLAKLNLWG